MDHRTRSILIILFLMGIMILLGLVMNANESLTGALLAKGIACYEDGDCDDYMQATEDICRNPGTEYSLCINR